MLKIQSLYIKKKDLIQWILILKNIKKIELKYTEIKINGRIINNLYYFKDLRRVLLFLINIGHPTVEKYQEQIAEMFRYPLAIIDRPLKPKFSHEWIESKTEYYPDIVKNIELLKGV